MKVQALPRTAKRARASGSGSLAPTGSCQTPASHPKYTNSLVSASLGWIRAQLWGPHPPSPVGLNLGSQGEGLGQAETMGSKGRGVSKDRGPWDN